MAYTYSKIASYTVGSGGVSTVDFLAIPQNYTDLIIKASARDTYTGLGTPTSDIRLKYNSSTAGYSSRVVYGEGTGTGSGSQSTSYVTWSGTAACNDATANTFSNTEIYIPNYTSSNYKSSSADGVGENNATAATVDMAAGLWSNTNPITSVTLSVFSNFMQYSTFTLYGVKAEV